MLDIQQKRKFRSFLYHRVTLVILFILVLLVAHSTYKVYLKKKESVAMKELSMKRLSELEVRNDELESKIFKLATVSGVEEEIRSKFSVAKEDENMVIIVRDDNGSTTPTTKNTSFWSKIRDFFR